MSKRILVEVKQEDIDRGMGGCQDGCPVAFAIHRTFPGMYSIHVGHLAISWTQGRDADDGQTKTPTRVQRFLTKFDTGKKVQPFKFYLKT